MRRVVGSAKIGVRGFVALLVSAVGMGCGFDRTGLADDNPACTSSDCGAVDSTSGDAPVTETDAPVEDTPVPPGTVVQGDFVSAGISGSAGGIEIRGSIHWSAAVSGSSGGITLQGTLQ